ncbi:MAG: PKD domain-containing protein [Candidatus Woesearchaeota archaeon]|jgi:PKD repeat protein
MNKQIKLLKSFSFLLILFFSISLVSALSLVAEFDNSQTQKSIMPGDFAEYYVLAVADQGLDHMTIKGEFYDETTGQSIFIKTLFQETTTEIFFFPNPYSITPEDYANLPGDYVIKITAEEWMTNGIYRSTETQLELEVIGNRLPVANFLYSPQNPTTITPVTFTSNSYDVDGFLVNEEWFIDGVKIGEGKDISHTFAQIGTYAILLRVTDNEGATASKTINLIVTQGAPTGYPIANFIYSPTSPIVNENIIFTSTSYDVGGQIVLEEWDLNNDGIFEISGHVVNGAFQNAETYIVTIKVKDNSGLQSLKSKQIVVIDGTPNNIPPVANFIYNPLAPTTITPVTFTSTSTDSDGTIISYDWFVDGILVSHDISMIRTFSVARTYIVKLVVTDNDGAQNFQTKQIIVKNVDEENIPPVANFSYTPINPIINEDVTFTSTSYDLDGYIVEYEWYVNDLLVGTQHNLIRTFASPGIYEIKLKVIDNDNLQDFETKIIIVKDDVVNNIAPIAKFIQSPQNPVVGELVEFTSTSTDSDGTIVLEEWFINSIPTSTNHVMTHTFNQAGTYAIKLRVTDNDGAQDNGSGLLIIIKNNNDQNGSVILAGIGCNPDVIRGEIQHCSAQVEDEIKDVKIIFKYNDTNEILGECYTNFKGYCHINPIITRPEGIYGVYALAYKENVGQDYTRALTTSFRVWEKRYEVRNLKVYEDEFKIQNYTFYRSEDMYASFDIYDLLTQKYLTLNSNVNKAVFLRINNEDKINMAPFSNRQNANVVQKTISNILIKITKVTGAQEGVFKYKLNYIPTSDDLLGHGKVFVIITDVNNRAGQGSRDVTVLNNEVKFTPPQVIIAESRVLIIDMKQYLSDVETPLNEIKLTWVTSVIQINQLGDNVLKITMPANFNGNISVRFTVDDTDGSIIYKNVIFADKASDVCAPNAILSMAESVTVGTIVHMDGSLSTAGCNASIIKYKWEIFKQDVVVQTIQTTVPYYDYTFNSNAEYKIRLTIYTNKNKSDYDEKLLFAGRVHQDIVIGQEDDLFVDYFDVTGVGLAYGEIECGKQFEITVQVSNDRDDDIKNLKITFAIPELGYELEGEKFRLDSGDTKVVTLYGYLDMMKEEVPPGDYIAMIGVSDTDTLRNKYFPLTIK